MDFLGFCKQCAAVGECVFALKTPLKGKFWQKVGYISHGNRHFTPLDAAFITRKAVLDETRILTLLSEQNRLHELKAYFELKSKDLYVY